VKNGHRLTWTVLHPENFCFLYAKEVWLKEGVEVVGNECKEVVRDGVVSSLNHGSREAPRDQKIV